MTDLGTGMIVAGVTAAQAPLLAAPHFRDEGTSPLVTTLAHVPEVLDVTLPFVAVVLGPSAVPLRTKELVILRASALQQCEYCVNTHSVAALDSGASVQEVRALAACQPPEVVASDAAEVALIGWVDAVAGAIGPVAPSSAAALRRHYSDPEVVELTLLCAATIMLNRYCTALQLPTGTATLDRLTAEGLA